MKQNILVAAIRYIAVEFLWDIVYFPIWWYTKGLTRVVQYCLNSARFHIQRRIAIGVWLRSMFKPMYGDYTREGRIISFFMRIIVLFWKFISMIIWLVVLFVFFLVWVLLPLAIIYYFLFQLFDVPFFTYK